MDPKNMTTDKSETEKVHSDAGPNETPEVEEGEEVEEGDEEEETEIVPATDEAPATAKKANAVYIKPSELMAADANLRKLTVGMTIDPTALGWAPHPVHGRLPAIRVTEVTSDGRLSKGEFTCIEPANGELPACSTTVEVHSGDWFQKRFCPEHKSKHKGSSKRLDPAVKAANEAKRATQREQERAKKAQDKIDLQLKKAQELAKAAQASAALVEKVAEEKGVQVSKTATAA